MDALLSICQYPSKRWRTTPAKVKGVSVGSTPTTGTGEITPLIMGYYAQKGLVTMLTKSIMKSAMSPMFGALVRAGLVRDQLYTETLLLSCWGAIPGKKRRVETARKIGPSEWDKLVAFVAASAVMNSLPVEAGVLFLAECREEERVEARAAWTARMKEMRVEKARERSCWTSKKMERICLSIGSKIMDIASMIFGNEKGTKVNQTIKNMWLRQLGQLSAQLA